MPDVLGSEQARRALSRHNYLKPLRAPANRDPSSGMSGEHTIDSTASNSVDNRRRTLDSRDITHAHPKPRVDRGVSLIKTAASPPRRNEQAEGAMSPMQTRGKARRERKSQAAPIDSAKMDPPVSTSSINYAIPPPPTNGHRDTIAQRQESSSPVLPTQSITKPVVKRQESKSLQPIQPAKSPESVSLPPRWRTPADPSTLGPRLFMKDFDHIPSPMYPGSNERTLKATVIDAHQQGKGASQVETAEAIEQLYCESLTDQGLREVFGYFESLTSATQEQQRIYRNELSRARCIVRHDRCMKASQQQYSADAPILIKSSPPPSERTAPNSPPTPASKSTDLDSKTVMAPRDITPEPAVENPIADSIASSRPRRSAARSRQNWLQLLNGNDVEAEPPSSPASTRRSATRPKPVLAVKENLRLTPSRATATPTPPLETRRSAAQSKSVLAVKGTDRSTPSHATATPSSPIETRRSAAQSKSALAAKETDQLIPSRASATTPTPPLETRRSAAQSKPVLAGKELDQSEAPRTTARFTPPIETRHSAAQSKPVLAGKAIDRSEALRTTERSTPPPETRRSASRSKPVLADDETDQPEAPCVTARSTPPIEARRSAAQPKPVLAVEATDHSEGPAVTARTTPSVETRLFAAHSKPVPVVKETAHQATTSSVTAIPTESTATRQNAAQSKPLLPAKELPQTTPSLAAYTPPPPPETRRSKRQSTGRALVEAAPVEAVSALQIPEIIRDKVVNGIIEPAPSGSPVNVSPAPLPVAEQGAMGSAVYLNGGFVPPTDRLAPPQPTNGVKRSSGDADLALEERDRTLLAKKMKLDGTVERDPPPHDRGYESWVRETQAEDIPGSIDTAQVKSSSAMNGRTPRNSPRKSPHKQRAGSGSPLSDLSSPPASGGDSPPPIASLAKLGAKRARIKQSPKKQSTIGAEQDRATRGGSPSNGDTSMDPEDSDNNDFCTSCGGSGYLVCCDGCDRAFHFTCADPPLNEASQQLDEAWFCHICTSKRTAPQRYPRGLFSALLSNLDKRNTTIFQLPASVRDHFDGVGTAKDGSFTDAVTTRTRHRAGYDEPLDLLKLKDAKGGTILCYRCGRSAAGKRELVTCDTCPAHWHLDCLSPPLANPPFRDVFNRKSRDWLCPLHVEHELREVEPERLVKRRKLHLRRPRNAKVQDTQLIRGSVNDGIIDVIDDSSSDESDWDHCVTAQGVVLRLPSKGIKLDFIDKVNERRHYAGAEARAAAGLREAPAGSASASVDEQSSSNYSALPSSERQVVLSLLQLAEKQAGPAPANHKPDDELDRMIVHVSANIGKQQLDTQETLAKYILGRDIVRLNGLLKTKLESMFPKK